MDLLRFMTAGSVDDGKSTLIGRLFNDAGLILEDQLNSISKHGTNLAFFTDGLKEERAAGITIDVAYRYFETKSRKFIVADSPGHFEFTRNMVTAATQTDAVLILIDGTRGVTEQTRRHTFLARWLGIGHINFLVNKMDLIGYDELKFSEIRKHLLQLGNHPVTPISALTGENILRSSPQLRWFQGPTLMDWLHGIEPVRRTRQGVFFPVQLASEEEVSGTLKSGVVSTGDKLLVNGGESEVRVREILQWPEKLNRAGPGQPLRLKLDRNLKRGDLLSSEAVPLVTVRSSGVELCYLSDGSMSTAAPLILRIETREIRIRSIRIEQKYDLNQGQYEESSDREFHMNGIYCGIVEFSEDLTAYDGANVALIDPLSGATVAAGILRP